MHFYGELVKIILQLSSNTMLSCSTELPGINWLSVILHRQDSTDSVPRTRKLSSQELEQIFKLTQQEQMLHEQDMSAVSCYHRNPKLLETRKNCGNHPKIQTMWLYRRIMSPNDAK